MSSVNEKQPNTTIGPTLDELVRRTSPDCLPPPDIARKAETVGVSKANLNALNSLLLGILAGAFIGLGAMLCTLVTTQSGLGYGLNKLVGGAVFSLGLILVVIAGAELFTGNTLLVMGWFSGRINFGKVLRNWAIVYFANLIGAIGLVAIVYASQQWSFNNNLVGANAVAIASAKVNITFWPALARGILCNALVCLAIWMSFSGKSVIDKIMAIIFPITAFVAAGFEHSIANMYFIPIGILLAQEPSVLQAANLTAASVANLNLAGFISNLVPVTIGNIIGGSIMVGAIYWVTYLRQDNAGFKLALEHWLTTIMPWRRPVQPAISSPVSGPVPSGETIATETRPANINRRKALPDLLATAVLARAAGDSSFFERLARSPETVLNDYNLTEDEKAALSSGDITWLEKTIASLPNPMTTYMVLKRYSASPPTKN